ncbi:MAG: FKBP-type peptidyl-prolyl cis-trans isomerase, partial [Desulfosarcinaceae bacterium]
SGDDGRTIATTQGEDPMELTLGKGKLIECFERSVIGMTKGQEKTVRLPPADAAGEKKPELIAQVPRHLVPEQFEDLKVGSVVRVKAQEGNKKVNARVTHITDQNVTLDANHPLAGETLVFDIELVAFV